MYRSSSGRRDNAIMRSSSTARLRPRTARSGTTRRARGAARHAAGRRGATRSASSRQASSHSTASPRARATSAPALDQIRTQQGIGGERERFVEQRSRVVRAAGVICGAACLVKPLRATLGIRRHRAARSSSRACALRLHDGALRSATRRVPWRPARRGRPWRARDARRRGRRRLVRARRRAPRGRLCGLRPTRRNAPPSAPAGGGTGVARPQDDQARGLGLVQAAGVLRRSLHDRGQAVRVAHGSDQQRASRRRRERITRAPNARSTAAPPRSGSSRGSVPSRCRSRRPGRNLEQRQRIPPVAATSCATTPCASGS